MLMCLVKMVALGQLPVNNLANPGVAPKIHKLFKNFINRHKKEGGGESTPPALVRLVCGSESTWINDPKRNNNLTGCQRTRRIAIKFGNNICSGIS